MNSAALITGASRGIGKAIALALAGEGWDVLINYANNKSAAEQTSAECQSAAATKSHASRVVLCRADVSNPTDRDVLISTMRNQFGRIDLLVNNAGVAPLQRADLLDATVESFDRVLNTNLKGPFFLTQAIAKWMLAQVDSLPPSSVRPRIINISSVSAYTASISRGDYCMAKAGLSMMTKLFASRLAAHGIGVFEIRPGIIATDMTAAVKDHYDARISGGLTPIQRWGQPEDVAQAVLAIAQNRLPFSTGEIINVDGGFHLHRL